MGMTETDSGWPRAKRYIRLAMDELYKLDDIRNATRSEHFRETPERIAQSMLDMYEGCRQEPREVLRAVFPTEYEEIVYVNDINFVSVCAHHGLFFFGKCHFGYLPDKKIVGLSKIPRLIQCYGKRPQVQEEFTGQVVDTFNEVLKPLGCGMIVEAYHLCMMVRGVKSDQAYTKTSALRGVFKDNPSTKQEFLDGIRKTTEKIWP